MVLLFLILSRFAGGGEGVADSKRLVKPFKSK